MEIWIRLQDGDAPPDKGPAQRYLIHQSLGPHLRIEDGRLMSGQETIGAFVVIKDGATQRQAVSLIGSVEWLLVECEDWSMIPLENLIAARRGSPTKIAAMLTSPMQAQGAGFALEEGVDALVVDNNSTMIDAALSVQAQRTEPENREPDRTETYDHLDLVLLEITAVEEAGLGERYCLDFLASFQVGEGILVGSSASAMFLVHSETIPSSFVPTRPFRVNAGSPHSYVLMADGSTKYMAELNSGDRVLAVNAEGNARPITLGRVKIEQRPMVKVTAVEPEHDGRNPNESHVFMQQAETVRLMTDGAEPISVTLLSPQVSVYGKIGHGARHIGTSVTSSVEER